MLKQPLLQVVEGCSGFYLYHNPSGRCACMGDGVDNEFYLKRLEIFVRVGEEHFVEAWQAEVDDWAYVDYMEAYFYDLWALEVYEAGIVCLFVVTDTTDNPCENALIEGLFVQRDGAVWEHGALRAFQLGRSYKLMSYLDLSWAEQEAIADALDEYEEAN